MCQVEVWVLGFWWSLPRGSVYTTIMELGPKNHNGDGLLGPNSIMVVYMDPLSHCIAPTRDSRDSVNIPSSLGFTAHGALFLILSPSVSVQRTQ